MDVDNRATVRDWLRGWIGERIGAAYIDKAMNTVEQSLPHCFFLDRPLTPKWRQILIRDLEGPPEEQSTLTEIVFDELKAYVPRARAERYAAPMAEDVITNMEYRFDVSPIGPDGKVPWLVEGAIRRALRADFDMHFSNDRPAQTS